MLYEIAHVIKERFRFLWGMIEWGNAEVFALMHCKGMARIPDLLTECSGKYTLRLTTREDVDQMKAFFAVQPKEAFTFFQPHEFDEKGIKKVVLNRSFLTFVAMDGNEIAGYFFMRSFVNGKTSRAIWWALTTEARAWRGNWD